MIVCTRCNAQMLEGALFCDECGFNLLAQSRRQSSTTQIDTNTDGLSVRSGWGTASFDEARHVVLYIRDIDDPITIVPHDGFVLGRADADRKFVPDLDLGEYGGLEKGVSRKHAQFRRGEDVLAIVDVGSANGTYLNGVRLGVEQPRILRDGDEVRLGNMTIYVYFQ